MDVYEKILPNIGKESFKFSTGNLARQANGSVVVSYSDTVVLVTVCVSQNPQEEFSGFVPLTVEYQERTYAMGKIPGGFIKREGRPKDTEILSARLIDRSIRPLFPQNFIYPVQIIVMVLSSDGRHDPDVLGINGASLALLISDIPYSAAVGAVRIAKSREGDFIINPTYEERETSMIDSITQNAIEYAFTQIEKKFVREKILKENKRPDKRDIDEIREIDCEVSVLPRTHGSALFRRGQTQALATTTLGTSSDEQLIEALEGEKSKRFMLHYTFPPFSVGEIKPLRGPSRREIGHGALAEKALSSVIPSEEEFPYTIRVVSEILESNGSSSMATVCAASLSLMDAGVPIKKPVAGVALGLIKEGDSYVILTDIAGLEDAYGDMDFKVAGTCEGVTAIQLDLKIDGLDYQIIEETLKKAKNARLVILERMNHALSLPRKAISKYAPKIKSFKVDLDKIGDIIGPGGKTIRKIIRQYNVTIDIDDETGRVSVVAETEKDLEGAVETILKITQDIQVGKVYPVKITRIVNFGAFCEIFPGKIGLIHISEISHKFVKNIRDFVKEGQIVKAKVINIDPTGRITLSLKQVP